MSRSQIRIGVIGLGRIGWGFHCSRIAKHPDFELAAVVDPLPARLRQARRVFGCPGFPDYRTMLKQVDLDAAVVATPTHLHKENALACFKAGLHVFMEKPMAASVKEAKAIAQAARRAGRVLTIFQPHRASRLFNRIRKLVDSGAIGRVYQVRKGMFNFSRRNDWQSLRKFGGGMLRNYGGHGLDILLQMIGYDIKRVFCDLRLVASLGDAEDVVKVVIETRKGNIGELDINQALTLVPYEFEVYGTRGVIRIEKQTIHVQSLPAVLPAKKLDASLASRSRQYPADKVRFRTQKIVPKPSDGVDVYTNFAAAIRGGTAPFVKPQEVIAAMELIERCDRDSRRIQPTPL